MVKYLIIIYLSFIFILSDIYIIECRKGGGGSRTGGGGGGFFGGKSRPGGGYSNNKGSYSNNNNNYGLRKPSSGFGKSVLKGVVVGAAAGAAFGIMSNLVSRRHMYPSYDGSYNYYTQPRRRYGSTCINNEDFNGTIIGTFKCPLDGFNDDDIYCCGPVGYQYCCKFFDSGWRTFGIVFLIISIIVIFSICLFCSFRIAKGYKNNSFEQVRNYFRREPREQTSETQIRHINRELDTSHTPFINKPQQQQHHQVHSNLPYPVQNKMPQPINSRTLNDDLPPPYPIA